MEDRWTPQEIPAHEAHCSCILPAGCYSTCGWHIRPETKAHDTAYERCPHWLSKVQERIDREKIENSGKRAKRNGRTLYADD